MKVLEATARVRPPAGERERCLCGKPLPGIPIALLGGTDRAIPLLNHEPGMGDENDMISQSTGFGFDANSATLEARVWLEGTRASALSATDVESVKTGMESRLRLILANTATHVQAPYIAVDAADGRIALVCAMPLGALTFRDMQLWLRKMERIAERLAGVFGRHGIADRVVEFAEPEQPLEAECVNE